MKSDESVQAVMTKVNDLHQKRRDFISHAHNLRLQEDGNTLLMENGSDSMAFRLNDLALGQINSAMGIPAKYAEQMRRQKPDLLATNVNAWLAERDQSYMIRSHDEGPLGMLGRAFLSDRYRRLDNLDVAEATLPLFAGKEGFEIVSAAVTERKFYLMQRSLHRCFSFGWAWQQ